MDADHAVNPQIGVLQAVQAALPAVAGAALSSTRSGKPYTAATLGDLADSMEARQRRVGQGPTLQALRERGFLSSADLAADARWPKLCSPGAQLPARAVLCCPLRHALPQAVTLTLYGAEPGAFTHRNLALLNLVLVNADIALAGLAQHRRTRHLQRALKTNERIGVAIGILVGLHRYTEDDAYTAMATASQALNRKLNDIATEIVLTGALPQTPAVPAEEAAALPAVDMARESRPGTMRRRWG